MSQTNSLPPFNEIINLADYASKGQVTRDVGSNWQYMGQPSEALGGLQGSPLASPLARPYLIGKSATGSVATQHEATARYRQWLWQQITSQSAAVLDALRAVGPQTVLACWCDPPCYCRIIAGAAAWFHTQESSHLAAAEAPASYKRANQPPPAREAQEGDLYCEAHDAPMKRWTRGKQSWVSHRLPDGTWCRGRK
jgi:Domain of unknown function (DUF4326)